MTKLQKYLIDKAKLEGDSSRQWKLISPDGQQTHYRAGAANNSLDTLKFISLNPDYNEEVK